MNHITNHFSWKVAGEAGHGILNAGLMFARTCQRGGLYVFATAEYPSLIRGGHNHLDVRVEERPVLSHTKHLNLLVALNKESITKHARKLTPGGGIIFDPDEYKTSLEEIGRSDIRLFPLPLLKISNQCGGMIMRNVVAMGATMALIDFDLELFNQVLRDNFGTRKGSEIAEQNIKAAKAGYDYVKQNFPSDFIFRLEKREQKDLLFMSGNEALSFGAIKAGCKFFSGYPMTPASSIMHTMAAQEKNFNLVVKHTEDEIAGINMAIGAAHAGARAMTATSGGGFALMTEGFGLAAQTETPLVVVEAMRPGPATGMATHSGQGDLRYVLHASTDEFPRVVIAPGTVEECFYFTAEAFNIAERYQMPVLVLTDKYLGESFSSTPRFDESLVKIDRGKLLTAEEASKIQDYKRYLITEDGVSPRAIPGLPNTTFCASSYEHDEHGFEREEEDIRMAMHEKRFRKFALLAQGIPDPPLLGPQQADLTIVTWGSTKGPALEAMRLLAEEGITVNLLPIVFISPLPSRKIAEVMKAARKTFIIEGNKTAQLAGLIKEKTALTFNSKILKYDGRPFNPEDIATAIKDILAGSEKSIILNGVQHAEAIEKEKLKITEVE